MADEIEWTPVKVKLGDLSHWADNPVTLGKAQAKKLLRSKEKLGKMQTLAIGPSNGDGKYPLYDGHQRANVWGAAFGMGLEVWALQSSRALTDEERHAVPIMLRTAAGSLDWDVLAGWTDYPISEWGLDDDALQGLKFDIAALGNLLESEQEPPKDAEPQIDRAEELNKKWQVKTGDLWRIGEHRLLCGDSTKREDVERVMQGERAELNFTSPPYSDMRDYRGGDLNVETIAQFIPAWRDFSIYFALNLGIQHKDGEVNQYWDKYIAAAHGCGLKLLSWNLWNRQGTGMTVGQATAMFCIEHEFIFIFGEKVKHLNKTVENKTRGRLTIGTARQKDGSTKSVNWVTSEKRQLGTVFFLGTEKDRTNLDIVHSASFPVEFPSAYIEAMTNAGEIAAEPFAGSGTTIVACQNLGRKCRAIEISPAYCAVTLERMTTAFPGVEIARLEPSVISV